MTRRSRLDEQRRGTLGLLSVVTSLGFDGALPVQERARRVAGSARHRSTMHRRDAARVPSPRVMWSDIGSDTIARADGVDVSVPEFRLYRRHACEMLGLEGQSEAARRRLRLEIGLVEELIDRALLVAAGRKRRVPIPPDELELRHHTWLERLGGPTEAALSIDSFGLTPKQFRDLVRRELLAWRVRSLLTAHVAVSDRQVQQFFKRERLNPAHASLFVDPVRAEVAHVLIEAQPRAISARLEEQGLHGDQLDASLSEDIERRRVLAETIRDAAAAGTSLVALAAAFSEDVLPQENGGSLDVISPGTCDEPLERVVFSLRPGEVGPVVHTARGFHIVKVLACRPARERTLEEVHSAIHNLLLSRDRAAALDRWLDTRRAEAQIIISPMLFRLLSNDGEQSQCELAEEAEHAETD